eukprot:SAG11_NODE_27006_length_338_cov_0.870293_1_plen_53_part_10
MKVGFKPGTLSSILLMHKIQLALAATAFEYEYIYVQTCSHIRHCRNMLPYNEA